MGTLLTFLAVGLVTLIAAGVVISVLGAVLGLTFGLAQFLLFKVAPIMFLGTLVGLMENGRTFPPWKRMS